MKVTYKDEEYEVNMEAAILAGSARRIINLESGDVYTNESRSCGPLLLIEVGYRSFGCEHDSYIWTGSGGLNCFSNYKEGQTFSRKEIIDQIIREKYIKLGNISAGVGRLINELRRA